MAKQIVAGNWKMNLNLEDAKLLAKSLDEKMNSLESDVQLMIFPPSLYLNELTKTAQQSLAVGVQNFSNQLEGAFTGELSIQQIKSVGGQIGLIGHSERRALFGESHELLKSKVDVAIQEGFEFIFCCGEPLEARDAGTEYSFVKKQLEESLFHLSSDQMKNRIIAYEPVWAIGTGRTATADQAEKMHKEIRTWLSDNYSEEIANSVSILYGGSCKPENAADLFACPNVDGGLIGGAALKADSFMAIANAF